MDVILLSVAWVLLVICNIVSMNTSWAYDPPTVYEHCTYFIFQHQTVTTGRLLSPAIVVERKKEEPLL